LEEEAQRLQAAMSSQPPEHSGAIPSATFNTD
jgi:hypothetical protein